MYTETEGDRDRIKCSLKKKVWCLHSVLNVEEREGYSLKQ